MSHIDIRIEFDDYVEDYSDGDSERVFVPLSVTAIGSDISETDREFLAQLAVCSRIYQDGVATAVLEALGDDEPHSVE